MKLSTRLLLPLLAAVAVVMLLYGTWALRQREATLFADAARETVAYAAALSLAVERALQRPEFGGVQEIIDQLTLEPSVYGVLVYDTVLTPLFRSDPGQGAVTLPENVLRQVISAGETVAFERQLEDVAVYSVVRPLRNDQDRIVGALEVAQPLTFVEADKARVRQRYVLNTLTLVVALIVLVAWIVRRFVSRPLERFSTGVRTLGRGDLGYRLDVADAGGELAEVAAELNRMAAHLQEAQGNLLREAEERLTLERRLRQSERLAAMGELAAGVAHEIAAPLHVIRGRAELLLRGSPDSTPTARNLRIITLQIDRITLIVKNLMNFARRREPRLLRVDLVELMHAVLEFLDGEIERADVEVVFEAPPSAYLRGDPDLLHQVFLNLLINALHALESSDGEPRRIQVRILPTEDEGTATPELEVEIRDSGPGIPIEHQKRVFDPFFTTKTGSQGTGLGLSVALAIVEDHGGRIAVDAGLPRGAVFRVTLPAERSHASAQLSNA